MNSCYNTRWRRKTLVENGGYTYRAVFNKENAELS